MTDPMNMMDPRTWQTDWGIDGFEGYLQRRINEIKNGEPEADIELVTGYLSMEIEREAKQGATDKEWLDSQAFCVAEEAGEFIGEYRRNRGFARRAGDREAMLEELADVVISSYFMFAYLQASPSRYIGRKLEKIMTRGYVNKES